MDIALKAPIYEPLTLTRLRFNPYSDGYCSESIFFLAVKQIGYWFQSLFWWILLWKILYLILPLESGYVSILILMDIALKVLANLSFSIFFLVVSILILMDIALKDRSVDRRRDGCIMFQSLFWWILLWKYAFAVIQHVAHHRFNPYSDGYCSESCLLHPISMRRRQFVSILILMDIALKAIKPPNERVPIG